MTSGSNRTFKQVVTGPARKSSSLSLTQLARAQPSHERGGRRHSGNNLSQTARLPETHKVFTLLY